MLTLAAATVSNKLLITSFQDFRAFTKTGAMIMCRNGSGRNHKSRHSEQKQSCWRVAAKALGSPVLGPSLNEALNVWSLVKRNTKIVFWMGEWSYSARLSRRLSHRSREERNENRTGLWSGLWNGVASREVTPLSRSEGEPQQLCRRRRRDLHPCRSLKRDSEKSDHTSSLKGLVTGEWETDTGSRRRNRLEGWR